MNIKHLLTVLLSMALMCEGDSFAGEVQALPSFKGATITIKFEQGGFIGSETLKYDEIIESGDGGFVYIPKGASVFVSICYGTVNKARKFYNYTVSGEDRHFVNFEETPKPTAITFTGNADGIYHGRLRGYRTCDRWPNTGELVRITITLPHHVKEPCRE